ncbi:XrtA/PEP-CTERM system TPR-repeat protein PrsT [Aquabacterium humicola]|uniref:XrtA/PEP-CTERM system TPR-repeat protein PrsT n=1 Tax=Aquabacterium humicola TaxID=3237377 RepID=UPI0025430C50|nr:XrtA/PEP-CTERM system TPR-repeat protein PrsT [Rubrivivax pictus]
MKPVQLLLAGASLAIAAQLGGCSRERSASESIASAKAFIEKHDFKAAGIELKNALQSNPQSGEARYLLGRALYELGEPAMASVELGKALELQYSESLVLPLLARSLVQVGQLKRVVDSYAGKQLDRPEATADLKIAVAMALNGLRRKAEAEAMLAEALQIAPKYAEAQVFQARMKADGGDFAGALQLLDAVTTQDPKHAEAWRVRGDILYAAKGDAKAAMTSYEQALAAKPDDLLAHNAVISLHFQARDLKAAQEQFKRMQKLFPGNVQTRFYDAQLAFAQGEHLRAREVLLQLVKAMPNSLRVLQLAGANEMALNALVQAEAHLSKAVQLHPEVMNARVLLARVHMRSGQPAKAIGTLSTLLEQPSPPAEALSLAAEAYLESGDAQRAEVLFGRAAKARPDDAKLQTGRARAMLAKGQTEAAFAELTRIAAVDRGMEADLALISAMVRRNELPAALKAVGELERKQPDSAFVANIRGDILMRQGDNAGARAGFERALKIDAVYFPSVAGLAALDQLEGKTDAARKRFEAVLATNAKHVPALLALAKLSATAGGNKDEIVKLLQQAQQASPADMKARAALIDFHLVSGEPKQALAAAREADALAPNNPEILDLLGRAQALAGEPAQAVASFNKWATIEPRSAQPHLRLAELHAGRRDWAAAQASYKRAAQINPESLAVPVGLVRLEVANRRFDEARTIARTLQAKRPGAALGYSLEGDVEATRKRWEPAASAYRTAVSKSDATTDVADKLYVTLIAAGKPDAAEAAAADWLKAHAGDVRFLFNLGRMALTRNELAKAEARFNEVLKHRPDYAPALNNIAWIMVQQGRPGAVPLAERAVGLMPAVPHMLDTLAMALAAEGKLDRAISVQKDAVAKAGTAGAAFTLGLARLYVKAGRNDEATAELKKLAALGDKFPQQAEVSKLLQSAASR